MVGKDGSIILGIDAGLPIGIETPVTALGSLPSVRFKIGAKCGDMLTKVLTGKICLTRTDRKLIEEIFILEKGRETINPVCGKGQKETMVWFESVARWVAPAQPKACKGGMKKIWLTITDRKLTEEILKECEAMNPVCGKGQKKTAVWFESGTK
jgi:hypothetical protein